MNNMDPLERVDNLIEKALNEFGNPPSNIIVDGETWVWFASIATAETNARIRWDKGRLLYRDIRLKWSR